jgi:ankyrin repeat protein
LSDLSTGTNYKRSKRKWDDGLPDAVGFATEYGDELLDYFVTAGDDPETSNLLPPTPPDGFDVNTPIDTLGNCAIHWACSMGDVEITRDLLARGANPAIQNHGCKETPLIRAVLFTNSYDKKSFHRIVEMLAGTIVERDSHGATVFHHIAETARSRGKWSSARYYCEVLINKMLEMGSNYVQTLLTSADENQDTPALCAIRNGCVKVATFLLNYCPEAGDIPNLKGETANDYLRALRDKRESLEQPPSSPLGRAGELSMNGTHRHGIRRRPLKQPVSRAASAMYESVGATFEEQRDRLASSFDAEITEKDTAIAESRQNLADLEAQRSKIRQDTYTLIARAGSDDENQLIALRQEYAAALRTIESLLEQKEHYTLQQRVRVQDQLSPVMSFRSANPAPLTGDELNAALPLAIELSRLQVRRKQLVIDIARLMGEVGTGEKLGKHRKLVAIATGIKEDELDGMSKELLESLQAGIPAGVGEGDGPKTPEGMVGVELA